MIARAIADEFRLRTTYFNAAYLGPSPERAYRRGLEALERARDPSFYAYDDFKAVPNRVRGKIAALFGGDAERVAHSTSVGEIVSHVANGLPLGRGDVVAVMRGDYPSSILPWMVVEKRRAFRLHFVDVDDVRDPERLAKALPKRTRALTVSHVMFNTGTRFDVERLGKVARERDMLLVVDCTQSLGGIALSEREIRHVDVLVGATYKWLLGPVGHAFAYFSKRALELIDRTHANWMTSVNSRTAGDLVKYTTRALPGARKFDRGQTPNVIGMAVLEGSLDLLLEAGLPAVSAHNRELAEYFFERYPRDAFTAITPRDEAAAIVALRSTDGKSEALAASLRARNFDVSVREGNLRVSFHLFNTREQVDSLLAALGA